MGNGIDSPGHPADNHKFRLCLSKFKDEAFGMLQPISSAGTGTNESKTGFSGQTFDSFPVKYTGRTLYFPTTAKDMPLTLDSIAESLDFPR